MQWYDERLIKALCQYEVKSENRHFIQGRHAVVVQAFA